MILRVVLLTAVLLICGGLVQAQRTRPSSTASSVRTITIQTEPNAIVWIDEIRRGVTDANGVLSGLQLSSGAHALRVRANGFKESSQPITAKERGEVRVRLIRTTDQAELLFQQAEAARESARDDEARQTSADLYRRTMKARAAFPAAHVGLARVLLDLNDTK